jgi:hypothetical protein
VLFFWFLIAAQAQIHQLTEQDFMIASPELILFAIDAGVKLGRKVHDVLVDETAERPLLLPLGDLFGNIQESEATQFFLRPENVHLIKEGGPYFGLSPADRLGAYKSILAVHERAGALGQDGRAGVEIIEQLQALEQVKKGFGAKHPARRILGTVVEIGIDFFSANPQALGRDSTQRRLISSFLSTLDATDFAEGTRVEIFGDLLSAALRLLGDYGALVEDDLRVQALLGGITKALVEDIDALKSSGAQIRREQFFRRIGSSLLRGGATALSQDLPLFLPGEKSAGLLVQSTLTQVLSGIQDQEDIFTTGAIELLFASALRATAENASLFTGKKGLQTLLQRSLTAMTNASGRKLFAPPAVALILSEAIKVAGENVETLIKPGKPQEQILASALAAMAESLAGTLAGTGRVQDLLSKSQLVDLTRIVFAEVARNPEQLLGEHLNEEKKTALAQVIGSVARALGDNPQRLVNGEGLVELVRLSLRVAVHNAGKLIDTSSSNPRTNLLFQMLRELVAAIDLDGHPRQLVSREVFLEIARRVLPLASANLETMVEDRVKPIEETIRVALELGGGALQNRINGANLPVLIEQLLRQVLWKELNLTEATAVELAACRALKAA